MNVLKRVSAACIPALALLLSLYSPTAVAWGGGSVDKYMVAPNEACADGFARNDNIYTRSWCVRISTIDQFIAGPDAACPAGFARDTVPSLRGICYNLETTKKFIAQAGVACPEGFARDTNKSVRGICFNLKFK